MTSNKNKEIEALAEKNPSKVVFILNEEALGRRLPSNYIFPDVFITYTSLKSLYYFPYNYCFEEISTIFLASSEHSKHLLKITTFNSKRLANIYANCTHQSIYLTSPREPHLKYYSYSPFNFFTFQQNYPEEIAIYGMLVQEAREAKLKSFYKYPVIKRDETKLS